jgi:hypothetical protein
MCTLTVPRSDLPTDEVVQALRDGLGLGYNVLPGMRQTRAPFSEPEPGSPDTIVVGTSSNRVQRAQVRPSSAGPGAARSASAPEDLSPTWCSTPW